MEVLDRIAKWGATAEGAADDLSAAAHWMRQSAISRDPEMSFAESLKKLAKVCASCRELVEDIDRALGIKPKSDLQKEMILALWRAHSAIEGFQETVHPTVYGEQALASIRNVLSLAGAQE